MRSQFLSKIQTSCGVCGGVIYGVRSLKRGTIRPTTPNVVMGNLSGKRTEYEGLTVWVHYPGVCWVKTLRKEELPDAKKEAANDRD